MLIQLGDVPEKQINALTTLAREIVFKIIKSESVSLEINTEALKEVAKFFLRDVYRLDAQQAGSVSIAKFAGYFSFWIRKIKPFENAYLIDEDGEPSDPILDVNETLAIKFGASIILQFRKVGTFTDHVGEHCPFIDDCKKTICFMKYTENFYDFGDGYHAEYIKYSMRHRTFGPHHFAIMFEQLIYGSCWAQQGQGRVEPRNA